MLYDIPDGMSLPADPVAWALRICRTHAAQCQIETMPSLLGEKFAHRDKAVKLGKQAPDEVRRNLLEGIAKGAPAHSSLELMHTDAVRESLRDPAVEPIKAALIEGFWPRLRELHPLGFYAKLTLWFSAHAHHYIAHCDLADGVLFQLTGEKTVKVWPVGDHGEQSLLHDHAYAIEPPSDRARSFRMVPGKALFIPDGAMHEVTVDANQVSVSMSLHMGSPHSVLNLCRDLDKMIGKDAAFSLPEQLSQTDKFHIFLFDPASLSTDTQTDGMPKPLQEALLEVVMRPADVEHDALAKLLDRWWTDALVSPKYIGPYPKEF